MRRAGLSLVRAYIVLHARKCRTRGTHFPALKRSCQVVSEPFVYEKRDAAVNGALLVGGHLSPPF